MGALLAMSRGIRGANAAHNLVAALALDHCNVVLALQVEPELRAVAEIAAEPHSGVRGDRAALVQDVGDAAGWHAQIEREPVRAEGARLQLSFQQAARMDSGRHGLSPMIIDNLDVVCVALPEFETDTPPRIDGHRPLPLAVALELMQPEAPERAYVLQRLGNVQC